MNDPGHAFYRFVKRMRSSHIRNDGEGEAGRWSIKALGSEDCGDGTFRAHRAAYIVASFQKAGDDMGSKVAGGTGDENGLRGRSCHVCRRVGSVR